MRAPASRTQISNGLQTAPIQMNNRAARSQVYPTNTKWGANGLCLFTAGAYRQHVFSWRPQARVLVILLPLEGKVAAHSAIIVIS